jgi:hypothetical protein
LRSNLPILIVIVLKKYTAVGALIIIFLLFEEIGGNDKGGCNHAIPHENITQNTKPPYHHRITKKEKKGVKSDLFYSKEWSSVVPHGISSYLCGTTLCL